MASVPSDNAKATPMRILDVRITEAEARRLAEEIVMLRIQPATPLYRKKTPMLDRLLNTVRLWQEHPEQIPQIEEARKC